MPLDPDSPLFRATDEELLDALASRHASMVFAGVKATDDPRETQHATTMLTTGVPPARYGLAALLFVETQKNWLYPQPEDDDPGDNYGACG